jgi:hypothetical protein
MADLLTAIQTLANKLIPNSKGEKRDTYVKRLAEYSARYAGLDKVVSPEALGDMLPDADWSGTWDEAYARWLDAADEALIAAGKPAGRDGAERGSLDRAESIAIAKRIGVFDELGGDNGIWGPEPGPGVSA